MSRVFAYLLRFAVVILGYLAASLAASAFIHLLFVGGMGWSADEAPWVIAGSLVFSIPFVALFVAYLAFMPAVVVILLVEFFGRRDWLTYAFGGAVVAAVVVGLVWDGEFAGGAQDAAPVGSDPRFILLMLGAGIVAGTAYWACAGRWAGNLTGPISPGPSGS